MQNTKPHRNWSKNCWGCSLATGLALLMVMVGVAWLAIPLDPVQAQAPTPEPEPQATIPPGPFDSVLERLGFAAADREEAKTADESFENWQLYLGIILAIQTVLVYYVLKRTGQLGRPWLIIFGTFLGYLLLFSKLSEWVYDLTNSLLGWGLIGKIIIVILALFGGISGVGSIWAYLIGVLYNDSQVMAYCVLPSVIVAFPVLALRLYMATSVVVPDEIRRRTVQQQAAEGSNFWQWAALLLNIGLFWGIVYAAVTWEGKPITDVPTPLSGQETTPLPPTEVATEEPAAATPEATAEVIPDVPLPSNAALIFAQLKGDDWDLFITSAEDLTPVPLLPAPGRDADVAWSSDGVRVVFFSQRDGSGDLYSINSDGSDLLRLTHNGSGTDYDPAWSPDGTRIVFVSERDGSQEIYIMNANGSNERRLTDGDSADYDPAWSPDGSLIVFVSQRDGGGDIYTMAADGSNPQRLTFNDGGTDYDPVWSPDGARIAFVSERDGNQEIYIMNANGSNERRLTDGDSPDYDPLWLPGGEQLLFVSQREGQSGLYVMNADGREVRLLFSSENALDDPAWLPTTPPQVAP